MRCVTVSSWRARPRATQLRCAAWGGGRGPAASLTPSPSSSPGRQRYTSGAMRPLRAAPRSSFCATTTRCAGPFCSSNSSELLQYEARPPHHAPPLCCSSLGHQPPQNHAGLQHLMSRRTRSRPACAALLSRLRPRQAPRRVRVLAPQHLPVTVQLLPMGRLPDGASASVAARAGGSLKVAPGMEAAYAVTYCPEGRDDFACSLLVETERESFAVPIIGTGAARVRLVACTAGSTTCAQVFLPLGRSNRTAQRAAPHARRPCCPLAGATGLPVIQCDAHANMGG